MTADLSFHQLPDRARVAELSLSRLTDQGTYRRAVGYADDRAVVDCVVIEGTLLEGAMRVRGRVRGSGMQIYTCVVKFTRTPAGAVTALSGACTCPVVSNCKHAFALAISAFRGGQPDPDAAEAQAAAPDSGWPVSAPAVPPWRRSLSPLLREDRPVLDDAARTRLGLQVELIRIGGPGGLASASQVKVGLRPVLMGASGKWLRTGISWDRLGAYGGQRQPPHPDHVQLLREISLLDAASRVATRRGYPETFIYLDSLGSRHIWDLLSEAGAVGVELVQAGREQRTVTLSGGEAEIALDLTRVDGRLTLEPSVTVDDVPTGPVDFALLGSPVHGLALWPRSRGTDPNDGGLTLVRTQQRLSAQMRHVLLDGTIEIPAVDEELFFREFLPLLVRRGRLISRDHSVTLPVRHRPSLLLTVAGIAGHSVGLDWAWQYRSDDGTVELPLQASATDPIARDAETERAIMAAIGLTRSDMVPLTTPGGRGPRLMPSATLTGLAAVEFVDRTLPRLRELAELSVTVVNEPTFRQAAGEPQVTISTTPSADAHDWFNLGVTVSIDGENVPFNLLFVALGRGEDQMFLPSGTYFALNREPFLTLRALIEEARSLEDVPGRSVKINRYQAALWQELEDLGVAGEQAAAWQKSVAGLLAADRIEDQPPPATLSATLRPYQLAGFGWLSFLYDHGLGGVLADDMGLGKTVQTLALICHARARRPGDPPFLVVAPTSVVGNWAAETGRFAPGLRVQAVTETQNRSGSSLAELTAGADLVITSYALFRLDNEAYALQPWSGLILDEAQFIKNHLSKSYQCAKNLVTPFKLAITGTPMENNLMELWALFSVTSPGLFAPSARFREYYQVPIEKDANSARLDQLRRRIRPLMLRRTKQQVVRDLPEKQEQVIELELNPQHRKVYERHLQRERQKVLGLIDDLQKNRFVIFKSLTLLRQLSLDAGLVDEKYAKIPSTKLDALMQQVDDLVAEGHRTLIFSQFTGFLDKVRRRMEEAGVPYSYLDGRTRNRPGVLAEFKAGTAPVFLISLKAGGVGLNLTEADYCILLDPWWNPATEAQAVDRVHRIGQAKKVMVYRLVAKDTIEEKVMALKATKAKLFASVMDAGAAQSAALTAGDIRELLS